MKQNRILLNWLTACGLAMAMIATATAETVKERTAKAVRVKGSVRYSTDNNTWQPLTVGTILRSGAVIQTSGDSLVDIALTEETGGPRRVLVGEYLAYQPTVTRDVIRVDSDSVLAIDKLTVTETGADQVSDTQLDLRSGRIFAAIKKVSAASTFEIKIPNGVAGIRGTRFALTAYGLLSVVDGAVAIAYNSTQGPRTETVQGGREYDARTGEYRELPPKIRDEMSGLYAGLPGQPMLSPKEFINVAPDLTLVKPSETQPPEDGHPE
jgi:FecR protein